ncbi:hypothetical protein [Streptomyces lydicus]|uniref:hypothetical protein n=1 Tax=Streptomyces lydicus TaxID=47763 RepID=UPI0013E975A5|nr:hypothetical protein [Streptomyces lydicus]MCZ1009969.1 hypothetical protein [Streptomyces lydicus]
MPVRSLRTGTRRSGFGSARGAADAGPAAADPEQPTIKGPLPWKDDGNAAYEAAYEEMTWCLARI